MIEEKLSRLTQEQRHEVEDFIDFLMSRDRDPGQSGSSGRSSYAEIKDFSDFRKDTLFGGDHESSGSQADDLLADYPEYGTRESPPGSESNPVKSVPHARPPPGKPNKKDPSQLLDWLD